MKDWFQDRQNAEAWAEAQNGFGDKYRRRLINPLVDDLCKKLKNHRARDFSAHAALPYYRDLEPHDRPDLAGVRMIDIGCGEASLGRWVTKAGASYTGFDSSEKLVEIAGQRKTPSMSVCHLDPESKGFAWGTLRAKAEFDRMSMVTIVNVLEHMKRLDRFLSGFSNMLSELSFDVPVLCVTLDPSYNNPDGEPLKQGAEHGALRYLREIKIETIEDKERNVVLAQLRSRRSYERRFRDAGFLIWTCEPLFYEETHALHVAGSKLPVFWAWLLFARQAYQGDRSTLRPVLDKALSADEPSPQPAIASTPQTTAHDSEIPREDAPPQGGITWSKQELNRQILSRARFYQVPPNGVFVKSHGLGGELFVLVRESAEIKNSSGISVLVAREGEVLGDLETAHDRGSDSFMYDAVAGDKGCVVAIINKADTDKLLERNTALCARIFHQLRGRLQLAVWRHEWPAKASFHKRGKQVLLDTALNPPRVAHLASLLLWAAACERPRRGRQLLEGVLYLPVEKLTELASTAKGASAVKSGILPSLRFLHMLRVIDAFVGQDAYKHERKSIVNGFWDKLVLDVTKEMLPGLNVHYLYQLLYRNEESPEVTITPTIKGIPKREATHAFDHFVERRKEECGSSEDTRLSSWMKYMISLDAFWRSIWAATVPHIIVIRDVGALRRFATDAPKLVTKMTDARADHLHLPMHSLVTSKALYTELSTPESFENYTWLLSDFVRADVKFRTGLVHSDELHDLHRWKLP